MKLDAIRKALFTPCKSKEELDRWIQYFLQIRLPDRIVSDESNASPLDVLWQLYDRAVRNDVEGWQRSMTYASRFSGKTLAASILELLIVLHTDRNIVHMAAIVDQAKKAQEYVKDFFERPYIRDFVVGDNAKEVVVVRYLNKKTGVPITENEFSKSGHSLDNFFRKQNYIRIIACTMQSTNGQHVEFMVVDEVDVIEKKNVKAYHQAKGGVPTARNGMEAMTLFTSTRKSRVGLVQKEIDGAVNKDGKMILRLNHWNIIDITEPCLPSRHKPEEPKQTYWINDADVRHIDNDAWEALPESEKSKWYAKEGFAGCAKCPLFAACKSRLATHQVGRAGSFETGGTALLLPIREVISKFEGATPEFITTEYLCRKPDTSGLVYPRLQEEVHKKTATQIAEIVTGEPQNMDLSKEQLLALLVHKGARFVSGMDFGYNHMFAVPTVAIWGQMAFVVDAVGRSHMERDDQLNETEHLKHLNSQIYPDPEDAGAIATFKRKGYRVKEWSKNAGSVKAGIEIVRAKLWVKGMGPTLFFLKGDPDIELLYTHVRDYRYTVDAAGSFTEIPDEDNDDYPDALRYAIMNVFGKDGGLKNNTGLAPVSEATKEEHWTKKIEQINKNAFNNIVQGLTGRVTMSDGAETVAPKKIKKPGFYFDG